MKKKNLLGVILILALASPAAAQTAARPAHDASNHVVYLKFQDLKWEKIIPELGDGSPKIAILHVDPRTQATQLMIQTPKNFHVPRHWHSANETHTVVSGTMIVEHDGGQKEELGPGSFNYMPAKMVHQAWTKPDQEALTFITVDGAWDVNWVDGPPKAASQ